MIYLIREVKFNIDGHEVYNGDIAYVTSDENLANSIEREAKNYWVDSYEVDYFKKPVLTVKHNLVLVKYNNISYVELPKTLKDDSFIEEESKLYSSFSEESLGLYNKETKGYHLIFNGHLNLDELEKNLIKKGFVIAEFEWFNGAIDLIRIKNTQKIVYEKKPEYQVVKTMKRVS